MHSLLLLWYNDLSKGTKGGGEMSANNLIRIERVGEEFIISDLDSETYTGWEIGRKTDLEEAIRCAEDYQRGHEVEYGIHFSNI